MFDLLTTIFKKLTKMVMDLIEVFVVSMSIFIVIYLFLMQPHQVKGNSMYPTFFDGEYLMTDKISFKTRLPENGEIVVFKSPIAENFDFIKRVIASPGDSIMVKGGRIWLNGAILDEPYLPPEYTTEPGQFLREGEEYTVLAGEFMCIGDNRGHSSDSREWGPVPLQNFVGRGLFRYWPVNKAGLITKETKGVLSPDTLPAGE